MELLALIFICVADWGCAASHMAYTTHRLLIANDILKKRHRIHDRSLRGHP